MTKITIDVAGLARLREHARSAGTLLQWSDLALEWMQIAEPALSQLKGNLSLAEEGLANYAQQYEWRPIETAPERVEALFWIRPGTREDGDWYCDTSGNPILAHDVPRLFMGMRGSWSSLMKATHWMPLPHPPQSAEHAQQK